MKKFLTVALLAITVFPACNSKQGIQDIQEDTIQQEVKIQSNSGANSYIEKYLNYLFDSTDKNKDGFLSRTELPNDSNFTLMDKNKDGKISIDEFKKGAKDSGVKKEAFRDNLVIFVHQALNLEVFKYSDLKKTYEGNVTKEQFIKIMSKIVPDYPYGFRTIFYVGDKNNDDKLNFSEFEDAMFGFSKALIDISNSVTPTPPSPTPIQSVVPNK
ncbi:MAG: EF-hand domain-containing protein [Candidatus Sericytochromatia bacterium]